MRYCILNNANGENAVFLDFSLDGSSSTAIKIVSKLASSSSSCCSYLDVEEQEVVVLEDEEVLPVCMLLFVSSS